MNLTIEHNGVTIYIESETALDLSGLQDFIDSLGVVEVEAEETEWDE